MSSAKTPPQEITVQVGGMIYVYGSKKLAASGLSGSESTQMQFAQVAYDIEAECLVKYRYDELDLANKVLRQMQKGNSNLVEEIIGWCSKTDTNRILEIMKHVEQFV